MVIWRIHSLLLQPQNADVGDVMMAAGVDAAGHLDVDLANLLLFRRIGEMARQSLRQRDRTGCGQGAIIQAGAADDVGDQLGIGGRQAMGLQDGENFRRIIVAPHMGQKEFCLWLTCSSSREYFSARSATTRICAAVASPGVAPMPFSESVSAA